MNDDTCIIDVTDFENDTKLQKFIQEVDSIFEADPRKGSYDFIYPMNSFRAFKCGGKIFRRI